MKKFNLLLLAFTFIILTTNAQKNKNADFYIKTDHNVKIKGVSIPYSANTGMLPVWNDEGDTLAKLYYTYYYRTDRKDKSKRPLVISFNGGPGSASVWMHLAYTGPKILKIDAEGFPIQPYGFKENPHSILDVADIVFVNPVNTAYSRIVDKEVEKKLFFGVNADIKYLAKWINTFVTRNDRWTSPKYLIGESYGTTRVAGLALELQQSQWMYLNGVIMVSPTSIGIDRDGPVKQALLLPYYAATAWYHKVLSPELLARDLEELLPEVEEYAITKLLPALTRGGFLGDQEKNRFAEKMSYYAGISKKSILQHNLNVPTSFFWKELLRDKGYTVGRLDSRYKGVDKKDGGANYDFDPALTAWLHAFTPAINYYVKNELNFETDLKYNMFGPVRPWDRTNNSTGQNLRLAMGQNPYLHVMIQSGFYDGGTDYFNAKYTMWQLDQSGKFTDRLSFKGYRSGHMMYLRAEDLANANEDIRRFIKNSLPAENKPAKY